MHIDKIYRDTKIVVNLDQIAENMKAIKELMGKDVSVMAVIKANAYGLGALALAPVLVENGAEYLAVATLTEAIELKTAYPEFPVFILGHTPDRYLHKVVELGITQTVFSLHQAKLISKLSGDLGRISKLHIKVDTGFHRLGNYPDKNFAEDVERMFSLPDINVEGIFSHLALADDDSDKKQFEKLCKFIKLIEDRGYKFKYKHIADSIACVDSPEFRMNMVRPGALIYGMKGFHKGNINVESGITFTTAISQIHKITKGEGVGYDYLWKAEKDSTIATLPFGYADGYPRQMRDKGYVIIRGQKAKLIGVLCMDQVIADVTEIPGVSEGDEAIIYGNGLDGSMTIQEASELVGTNKNDIICRLSSRPPRVYIKEK